MNNKNRKSVPYRLMAKFKAFSTSTFNGLPSWLATMILQKISIYPIGPPLSLPIYIRPPSLFPTSRFRLFTFPSPQLVPTIIQVSFASFMTPAATKPSIQFRFLQQRMLELSFSIPVYLKKLKPIEVRSMLYPSCDVTRNPRNYYKWEVGGQAL